MVCFLPLSYRQAIELPDQSASPPSVVLTCPNAAPTPEAAEQFIRSFIGMAKGMKFGAFKNVEQRRIVPTTTLPP